MSKLRSRQSEKVFLAASFTLCEIARVRQADELEPGIDNLDSDSKDYFFTLLRDEPIASPSFPNASIGGSTGLTTGELRLDP